MSTLNIASTGLNYAQKGLNVVSHNIANSGTAGYHKQRLESLSGIMPYSGGVIDSETKRYETFLDKVFLDGNSKKEALKSVFEEESLVEEILNKTNPENISKNLNSAFQEYSLSPSIENKALLGDAINFSIDQVNLAVDYLEKRRESLSDSLSIEEQNLTLNIDSYNLINDEILRVGSSPDLLDKRDQIIKDISVYRDVSIGEDGGLLQGKKGPIDDFENIESGKLKGLNNSIDSVSKYIEDLSESISTFKTSLNENNLASFSGSPLFDGEGLIADNIDIDLDTEGDNLNLDSFNETLNSFVNSLSSLEIGSGSKVNSLRNEFDVRMGIQSEIQRRIDSDIGVNLDEEALDQVKFERMYQGLSKVIQTDENMFNSLLEIV